MNVLEIIVYKDHIAFLKQCYLVQPQSKSKYGFFGKRTVLEQEIQLVIWCFPLLILENTDHWVLGFFFLIIGFLICLMRFALFSLL